VSEHCHGIVLLANASSSTHICNTNLIRFLPGTTNCRQERPGSAQMFESNRPFSCSMLLLPSLGAYLITASGGRDRLSHLPIYFIPPLTALHASNIPCCHESRTLLALLTLKQKQGSSSHLVLTHAAIVTPPSLNSYSPKTQFTQFQHSPDSSTWSLGDIKFFFFCFRVRSGYCAILLSYEKELHILPANHPRFLGARTRSS
jgi:hypothetical protein